MCTVVTIGQVQLYKARKLMNKVSISISVDSIKNLFYFHLAILNSIDIVKCRLSRPVLYDRSSFALVDNGSRVEMTHVSSTTTGDIYSRFSRPVLFVYAKMSFGLVDCDPRVEMAKV